MNRISDFCCWTLLGLITAGFLASCQQPGEALNSRKKRENEAEIDLYIKQNNLTPTKTEQGLYFVRTKAVPTGQVPRLGDEVRYHYTTRRLDGVLVDSTDSAGNVPATVTLNGEKTTGLTLGRYAGILNLKRGEEGFVLVPSYLDGGRVGSLLLPQYAPVRYDLRIVSVRTENQQIADYIKDNKLTVTTLTTDSIRVVKTRVQPTDSMAVAVGKKVTLNYVAKRLDGSVFENNSVATSQITIGKREVIVGLENGVTSLRAGEKALLIFKSTLAYGDVGLGSGATRKVGPWSPLVYEVTIVKVE